MNIDKNKASSPNTCVYFWLSLFLCPLYPTETNLNIAYNYIFNNSVQQFAFGPYLFQHDNPHLQSYFNHIQHLWDEMAWKPETRRVILFPCIYVYVYVFGRMSGFHGIAPHFLWPFLIYMTHVFLCDSRFVSGTNIPVPTHYFAVLTSCKNSSQPVNACELQTVSFLLPHNSNNSESCKVRTSFRENDVLLNQLCSQNCYPRVILH